MSRLLLLIAGGAILLGAQTPVGGPSFGFIFDASSRALRPILGIPGASIFGDPVPSGPLTTAALSLRQSVAIVNDGAWKALGLTEAASTTTVLPDGLPASARVEVSENGTAAAFYDKDHRVLSVVAGIGTPSMAARSIDLTALPGGIAVVAAADDGSLLVSASVPAGGEALVWMGQDGSTRQLASLQATASILLWNQGASALVVDRAANQIWKIQDPGGNAAITLLASDADGVSGPVGAALSADGNQLWIANAGTGAVLGIDLNSRAGVSLSCGFDLKALLPMADSHVFSLNQAGNLNQPGRLNRAASLTDASGLRRAGSGPLWILDTTPGADPRVVFVPALQPVSAPVNMQGGGCTMIRRIVLLLAAAAIAAPQTPFHAEDCTQHARHVAQSDDHNPLAQHRAGRQPRY